MERSELTGNVDCPFALCTETFKNIRNIVAHAKRSHGVTMVQVKSNTETIKAIETLPNFMQNNMDVDELTKPIISPSSGIGPHRQIRNRQISERHHPYTRNTSIPEVPTVSQVDLISNNIPSCEFLFINTQAKFTYSLK